MLDSQGFEVGHLISVCPVCNSSLVRRHHPTPAFPNKYVCGKCFWMGDVPNKRVRKTPKPKNPGQPKTTKTSKGNFCRLKPTSYVEIISRMLAGASIRDQFVAVGLFSTQNGMGHLSGNRYALKNKILRTYNVYYECNAKPCEDPDFMKIRVAYDLSELLIRVIQEEEEKLKIQEVV